MDRRVVVSPAQAEMLLTAVGRMGQRGAHLKAFFAILYYAALRPSEAVMLREADLHLPKTGWGRIVLSASASRAGTAWTDDGTARQERGLKHCADNETRTIPIPPVLVRLLRAHIKRFGTTLDGRVFQTARGGILQESGYNEVWDEARREALTPAQYRSPLGRRPYDLRHAAMSLWLNAGVPATEVARRAGHDVAVLLKIYAHCIDRSTPTASTARRPPPISASPRPSVPRTPRTTSVMRATATSSRHPEMAGQGGNPGGSGLRNRSHRPRPWPFPRPSMGWSVLVRGPHGPQNPAPTDA
ncbi:MAG TPA: tyrosine-type recombinase/integrase [Trebonia sp.]